MKKFFLFLAGLGFLAALAGCIVGASAKEATDLFSARKSLRGSGKLETRTVEVGKFEGVQVSRAIRAEIRPARAGEVVVEADDNLLELVVVKVEDGMLKIGIDKSVQNLSDHHIKVTVPYSERIGALKASSAATIVCDKPLKAREAELKASSAASIEATVEARSVEVAASSASRIRVGIRADECAFDLSSSAHVAADVEAVACDIEQSSASKLELKGSADNCTADLSSAATLAAARFEVKNADVETSSGSSARVHCTGMLRADASSGSSIRYTGDCAVRIDTSSGGSVRKN
ncbi:MAG: DUF2807 domain-containing protein [Alistipes sp.]|nr:DUF2807 domain-containing protein [Alistipes senegalensis]MCM1251153.1 DUF2807 domain-containing protein [Alistipes sp.]